LIIRDKINFDYITSGVCTPGDKLPTIRDLAKKYRVSYVTVVEAVRILAQEGKVVKRQGSGVYIPSVENRAGQNSRKIGYITNSFGVKNAFGYKILEGIERITRKSGYRLEVANSEGSLLREKEAVQEFVKGGVEGIVLYPASLRTEESEYLAREFTDVPIVTVDLTQPSMQRSSVVIDNFQAGYEMAKNLIEKGGRKIIFFHNILDGTNRAIQDRIAGSQKAVEIESASYGNELRYSVETWQGNGWEDMSQKLKSLMNSESCPDSIMAAYDLEAADIYFWLTSNGYKVPAEIKIVGFDNILPEFMPGLHLSDGYQYRWPTTNPDFMRLGERAVELLLENIKTNNKLVREIVLPCPVLMQRNNVHKKFSPKLAIVEVK
jgi:DNA-binding LacI/PurR family transcriptional regulator